MSPVSFINSRGNNPQSIGIGPTEQLNLRVSVASLVSLLFNNPQDGRTMLALEHTATLQEIAGRSDVRVRAKPFGGSVRLTNPQVLQGLIGHFHYDSEQSRREKDFRIQIHPASWDKIKKICQRHLKKPDNRILDSSPERELAEEFEDSLNVSISPKHYHLKPEGMIIENLPKKTDNVRAPGLATVRIYYVYQAKINDSELIRMILTNSRQYSESDLQKMVWEDARQGGRGRANAVLVLPLDDLKEMYQSIPSDKRIEPIHFGEHQLDGNVLAVINPKKYIK